MRKKESLLLNYDKILDNDITFSAVLGFNEITLKEWLMLKEGSLISLEKAAGESVEIYINDRVIGRGEVMVYDKNLAVRINEILDSNSVLFYFTQDDKR